MAFLIGFLSRVKAWVVIAAGVAIAVAVVIARSYSAGKSAAKNEAREKVLEHVGKAQKIRRDVAGDARNGDVPERVQKFYVDSDE